MKQFKLLTRIKILLLIILACVNGIPYFLLINYHRAIYFVSYVLILYGIIIKNHIHKKISKVAILRIFIFIWMLLVPYLAGLNVYSNRYFYMSGLLFYPFIYRNMNTIVIRTAMKCLILISCIISIQTLIALQKNPYAARMADTVYDLQIHGVGSYVFIYSIALASVMLFSILINVSIQRKNILLLIIMGLYIITIIKAHFLTAILIVILGNITAILIKPRKRKKIYILFIICTLIIIYSMLPSLFKIFLYGHIGKNGRLSFLFNDTNSSVISLIFNEFIVDRFPTLIQSFETIKKYPLTGIILQSSREQDIIFGQHSTIIDTFALWGIPVGVIYIWLVFVPFFKYIKSKKIKYALPIMISFFILALFNNIECTIAFVFVFIGLYVIEHND